jgi:hypothetical protein
MSRAEELRAQAQRLYEEAVKVTNGDERLIFVLRALELQTEAEKLEAEAQSRS